MIVADVDEVTDVSEPFPTECDRLGALGRPGEFMLEPFRREMLEASVDEVSGRVDEQILQPGYGWFPMWQS